MDRVMLPGVPFKMVDHSPRRWLVVCELYARGYGLLMTEYEVLNYERELEIPKWAKD